jgi:hypothetical protein
MKFREELYDNTAHGPCTRDAQPFTYSEYMPVEIIYKTIPYRTTAGVPTRVIFNEKKKATTLFFEDGSVRVVKASKDDAYDKTFGFLLAYFQKHSGFSRNKANKYLERIVKDGE